MKKMLSLVLCVLMLAGVFALASCGTNGDDTSDTSKTSGSGESSGSAGAESSSAGTDDKEALKAELKATFLKLADEVVVDDDSVTFQDASGDTPVTIRKNPQKVVNLYASFTTLWYEAGGTVVGCIGGQLLAGAVQGVHRQRHHRGCGDDNCRDLVLGQEVGYRDHPRAFSPT